MHTPGPIVMLFMFIIAIAVYLTIGALLLRFAGRWVLKTWLGWKLSVKVVVLNIVILLIANLLLGVVLIASGVMPMTAAAPSPAANLITFLISMLVSAYVYGHWITLGDAEEPIGFGKGLLIYWAQVLIVLAIVLILSVIAGMAGVLFG